MVEEQGILGSDRLPIEVSRDGRVPQHCEFQNVEIVDSVMLWRWAKSKIFRLDDDEFGHT